MTVAEAAHAQAGLDLLAANANLTVYAGKLPAAVEQLALPWVLVIPVVEWLPRDEDGDGGLDGLAATCLTTWYCHCAGATSEAALVVSGQVRSSLLNARPVVAGRVVNLVEQVSVSTVGPDEALGPALFELLAVFEMQTRPA